MKKLDIKDTTMAKGTLRVRLVNPAWKSVPTEEIVLFMVTSRKGFSVKAIQFPIDSQNLATTLSIYIFIINYHFFIALIHIYLLSISIYIILGEEPAPCAGYKMF